MRTIYHLNIKRIVKNYSTSLRTDYFFFTNPKSGRIYIALSSTLSTRCIILIMVLQTIWVKIVGFCKRIKCPLYLGQTNYTLQYSLHKSLRHMTLPISGSCAFWQYKLYHWSYMTLKHDLNFILHLVGFYITFLSSFIFSFALRLF
jgi:hypothetical protein